MPSGASLDKKLGWEGTGGREGSYSLEGREDGNVSASLCTHQRQVSMLSETSYIQALNLLMLKLETARTCPVAGQKHL